MASTMTRRPLPALVSLLALLILTGIVWWRVVNRDSESSGATHAATTTCPASSTGSAAPRTTPPPASTTPKSVTVLVLNSTGRAGIAGAVRTRLLADGFRIPRPAGNDPTNTTVTRTAEIRYGTAGKAGAELLQYYLPGSVLKEERTASATVTVSLGTAYKSVATTAQVKAAMTKVAAAPTASASASATASRSC